MNCKTSALALSVLLAFPAHAATWDGSAGNDWNIAANWTPSAVPNTTEQVIFPAAGANKAMNQDRPIGTTFTKLTFSGSGYALTGDNFTTLDPTGALAVIEATHATGTTTLNLPITLGEPTTISAVAGASIVFGTSSSFTHSTHELNFSGDGAFTLGGTSGGSSLGGVEFSGGGTLTINSNQNQSGTYHLSGTGVLHLNARLSGGLLVDAGATLSGTAGRTFGNCIMGGDLDPGGTSATTFTADGNMGFTSDGTGEELFFDLNGTAAGSGYDQVNVGGTLTTDDIRVVLRPGTAFAIGTTFVLFDKTIAGVITNITKFRDSAGNFINEGSFQTVGVNRFQYSYVGGDGNDFTATVVLAPLGSINTWDGGDVDDLLWSSAANWDTNSVPTAGQHLRFGGAATADVATINDLGGNFSRIEFTGAAGGFTIAPESLTLFDLTLNLGIQASHSGAACAVNNDLILGASQTFSLIGAANLTIGSGTSTQFNGFDLTVHCAPTSGTPQLALSSGLSGTGSLLKTGPGLVVVGGVGTSSNSYTGTTTVQEGELRLTRGTITAPANCIPGALLIGGGANPASVTSTQTEKIADTASVTVSASGSFNPGAAETIGALILDGGTVNSGSHILSVDGNLTANQDTTITSPLLVKNAIRDWTVAAGKTFTHSGPLTYSPLPGGIAVNKKGTGTLILAGTSGVTNFSLDAGTLQLDNNSATDTIGVLLNGGTLTGSGRAVRISSAAAGGTLSPGAGAATAVFEATRLSLNAATTVVFDLNGTTAGTGHDQFDVAQSAVDATGTVLPGNAALVLRETSVFPIGTAFTIIKNDLTEAVIGTFNGLAQGATLLAALNRYSISYTGGTGNDVVLTVLAPVATATSRVWDGGGAGDTNWMTAANWTGDAPPQPGDSLEFPAAHVTSINNFPAGMTFSAISFTGVPSTAVRSISGNALQLLGNLSSSLDDNAARQVNISTPLTLLSAATITNSGQRLLRILAAITTTATPLRIVGNSGAQRRVIFSSAGTISGPARLIVDLNASAELISGNTYGGGTEVRFGRITAPSAADIYTNGLTVGDGVNPALAGTSNAAAFIPTTIIVNPNGTLDAGSINCTGLALNGTLALPAIVTATNVTLASGLTTTAGDNVTMTTLTAPSLTQNGGTLSFTGEVTIAGTARLQSGALTLQDTSSVGQLQVDAGTLTQAGFLSVANNVTISGGTLSGVNPGDGLGFTGGGSHSFAVATTASLHTLGDAAFDDLIVKSGAGTLTVASVLRASAITVGGGFLHSDATNGNLVSGPATAITLNGGHLRGTGVFGDLSGTATAGSQISPGASPGRLTTSGIVAASGQAMQLNFEINSAVAATGHDQISVTGSSPEVTLAPGNNATVLVTISPSFVSPVGTEIVLISNEGANPISGTFAGKPQNFEETVGGILVRYRYTGGDGNDFTLTIISPPPAGEFRVWDGEGPDANWTTALNWVGNAAPNPGDALRFPNGAPRTTNTNNYPADTPFNGLKIEADYTIGGARLLLKGNVDVQPPVAATLALPLLLNESRAIILSGGGSLVRSGVTDLGAAAVLTLRHNSSGEINVTARIQRLPAITDGGVILDGTGTGLVKYNVAIGHDYVGETWVQRGVLQLTGASSIEVPGNLRIGGAGFTASVENPAGATDGRISNGADLIVETGGTHVMTGAAPVERIARLIMRGGSLAQPAAGQLIALDRIHAEGSVASTITTPVFFESSGGTDIDLILVEGGSSLTFTAGAGFLFGGAANPKLRKTGAGPAIFQATLTATELDCWEGTVILSGVSGQISGTTILNGGTVTGNGSLSGLAKGVAAGVPAGSPGGGTLTPSGPTGTGTGLLTCAGNLQPVNVSHLAFEIGGTTAVTQYDRIQVNGTALDLNRCVLDLSLINGFIPAAGQTFTLVTKSGATFPSSTPFAGKDEGVTFTAAGHLWSLTYMGGDGNDVVLTALGVAPTLAVTSFTFSAPPGGAAGKQVNASITGPASTLVNLEASDDLATWLIIASQTTSGAGAASFNVTDSAAGDRRFYKFTIP